MEREILVSADARETRVALLETPAGFELNSDRVIGRVADFFHHRLQNYRPRVDVIPARKRGTPFSPDDPEIAGFIPAPERVARDGGVPHDSGCVHRAAVTQRNLSANACSHAGQGLAVSPVMESFIRSE